MMKRKMHRKIWILTVYLLKKPFMCFLFYFKLILYVNIENYEGKMQIKQG